MTNTTKPGATRTGADGVGGAISQIAYFYNPDGSPELERQYSGPGGPGRFHVAQTTLRGTSFRAGEAHTFHVGHGYFETYAVVEADESAALLLRLTRGHCALCGAYDHLHHMSGGQYASAGLPVRHRFCELCAPDFLNPDRVRRIRLARPELFAP